MIKKKSIYLKINNDDLEFELTPEDISWILKYSNLEFNFLKVEYVDGLFKFSQLGKAFEQSNSITELVQNISIDMGVFIDNLGNSLLTLGNFGFSLDGLEVAFAEQLLNRIIKIDENKLNERQEAFKYIYKFIEHKLGLKINTEYSNLNDKIFDFLQSNYDSNLTETNLFYSSDDKKQAFCELLSYDDNFDFTWGTTEDVLENLSTDWIGNKKLSISLINNSILSSLKSGFINGFVYLGNRQFDSDQFVN